MKGKSKFGYVWVTLFLFVFSLAGHWVFAWFAYVDEQVAHHQAIEVGPYIIQTMRDTLENWQSEFLQLIWQVGGLTFLYCVGSPQSKEGDERKEAKLDFIIRTLDPSKGDSVIHGLGAQYPKN